MGPFKMFNTSQWFQLTDEQREKLASGEPIDITPDELETQNAPALPGDDMENDITVDVGDLPTGGTEEETPDVPTEETPDDLSDFEIADLDSNSDDDTSSEEESEIDLDNLPSEDDESSGDLDDISLDFEISDDNDDQEES